VTGVLDRAAEAWWAWAAPLAVPVAALVVVAWALDVLLARRGFAHARHAAWTLVAVRLAIPPSVGSSLAVTPTLAPVAADAPGAGAGAAAAFDPGPWFLAWLAGVALLGAVGLLRGRRGRAALLLGSMPAPRALVERLASASRRLGLARAPGLRIAPGTPVPAVVRLLAPTVVLPPRLAATLAPEALDHVLLHEAAHVRRRDLWTERAFALVHLLFWWHPLLLVARARARAAREACCDVSVAAVLRGETPAYRRTLLRLAADAHGVRAIGATALVDGAGGVLARLGALAREDGRRAPARRLLGVAFAVLLAGVLLPRTEVAPREDGELEAARRGFAYALAHPKEVGCLRLRFAAMRAAALSPSSPPEVP
jgi:beta-lactamase regulating signal transducer with metallopeptidase domain